MRARLLAPLLLLAAPLTGCKSPQRAPGPMPLPGGAGREAPSEPERMRGASAAVVRHSDPVLVRRPGAVEGYPLTYYAKRARVEAGGVVLVGPNGRAELLWPADFTSIVVLDTGEALLGEARTDQPLVTFLRLSRAQLQLTPEDRIALPGGAVLRGDPERASGPFLAEARPGDLVRIKNQSKLPGMVRFRGEELELLPGDALELPVLGPRVPPPAPVGTMTTRVGPFQVESTGRIEARLVPGPAGERLRVRATEDGTVLVGGVRVRLREGESFVFAGPEAESTGDRPIDPSTSPGPLVSRQ